MYNLMGIDDAFKKALNAYTRYDVMSTNKLCNEIKKVIFHDPATIVYWNDGTKTVVKSHGERFDQEKGLAMAIVKYLGGDHYYKQIIKKWTSDFEEVEDA
jgi:hypothetical protein